MNKAKNLIKTQRERLIGMLFGAPVLMPLFWYFYVRADWYWFHIYQRLFAVNRATETQRRQIWGILFGTPIVIIVLWYGGVTAEEDHLELLRQTTTSAAENLKRTESIGRRARELLAKLDTHSSVLARREAIFAPNWDAYAWVIGTIKSFTDSHRGVDIDGYSQPQLSDSGIFPKFPYRWATFHLRATGYYHEFGLYIADLENTFPYFRIQNIVIAPNTKPDAKPETLTFNFDLVTPVNVGDLK